MLLRLGRRIRVHVTMSDGTGPQWTRVYRERWASFAPKYCVQFRLWADSRNTASWLGFLKERENTREKTSGEKASVYHDRHYLSRTRVKYSLLLYKPLLIICFQVQGKKGNLFSWKTRPGLYPFSVLTHNKHHKEVSISDYSFAAEISWRMERPILQA